LRYFSYKIRFQFKWLIALSLDSKSGYSSSARELLRFGKREGKNACSSGDSYLRTMLWSASYMIVVVGGGDGGVGDDDDDDSKW
jgi:hypothetical protein